MVYAMLREWRHSPCLMTPFSAILLFLMSIFSLIVLLLQFPGFIIGLFIAPITKRGNWFVEFLYPFGLARWGHLKLLRWGAKAKNGVRVGDETDGVLVHSRCIEQRTEVVQGRVYIHPLPQLLDNVGYLIVCVPPAAILRESSKQGNIVPILGIIVDCAEVDVVSDQIDAIQDAHYSDLSAEIEIHAVLSTHKHHDHTAGNADLLKKHGKTLEHIYGGAIERVPNATTLVTDGYFITLPCVGENDMNSVASIECIATPSHTRGSITFALRNITRADFHDESEFNLGAIEGVYSYLFTGDTMFSAGAGVPFEADIEFPKDAAVESKTSSSQFKPNAGSLSLERCFAEILRRAVADRDILHSSNSKVSVGKQVMIYPGHEYTLDLLQRQFQGDSMQVTNSSWNRHQPAVFFELAAQFFVSGHRRHLPKSTRILTVPSSLQREFKINPYYRSLRKRGEHILSAINLWYKHGNRKGQIVTVNESETTYLTMPLSRSTESIYGPRPSNLRSTSSETSWNVTHEDLNRTVFTTMYSADLEQTIDNLKNGRIDSVTAAHKLSKLSEELEKPVVQRRPVPNTFSSEKKMYLGLLAMAVLGSPPSAMTASDSERMNMPSPVKSSDFLMISKSRLISSLFRLGLFLNCSNAADLYQNDLVQIINLLWDEARTEFQGLRLHNELTDLEIQNEDDDLLELGALKLVLYAVPYNKPAWFSKFCMPCDSTEDVRYQKSMELVKTMKIKKRSGGELVRHDIGKCPLCCDTLGCPHQVCVPASSTEKSSAKTQIFNRPRSSPTKKGGVIEMSSGLKRPSTSPTKGEGIEIRLGLNRFASRSPKKKEEISLNRLASRSPGKNEGVEMRLSTTNWRK